MLLLYIFALVMLFSLTPYAITMTKKAASASAMRRSAEYEGAKFFVANPFWYIGNIGSRSCDLHILHNRRVISVKVISLFSASVNVNFKDNEHYETWTVDKKSGRKVSLCEKKKSAYDFSAKLPEEWRKLPRAHVILMIDPIPAKIMKNNKILDIGDDMGEGQIYTVTSLTELIKKER